MEYLFMTIAAIAIAGQNTMVGLYNKKVKNSSPYVLALCFSTITLFCFLIYSQFNLKMSWFTVGCGLGAGAICFLHFICLQQALKRGPISLTNLFVSYSLLIPTIFSLIRYDKQLYLSAILGLVLLCASIAMTNKWQSKKEKKVEKDKKKGFNFWYLIFVLLAVATNGSFSILQQVHTRHFTDAGQYNPMCEYMVMTMSFVLVANLIGMFVTKKNREAIIPSFNEGWKFILPNGVIYFIILLMQMWLNAGTHIGHTPNMSVVNPVLAAGSLVLTLVSSIFIFKEKLTPLQWAGVGVGVTAIVLLNVNFVSLAKWNLYPELSNAKEYIIGVWRQWKY